MNLGIHQVFFFLFGFGKYEYRNKRTVWIFVKFYISIFMFFGLVIRFK